MSTYRIDRLGWDAWAPLIEGREMDIVKDIIVLAGGLLVVLLALAVGAAGYLVGGIGGLFVAAVLLLGIGVLLCWRAGR